MNSNVSPEQAFSHKAQASITWPVHSRLWLAYTVSPATQCHRTSHHGI